MVSVRSDAQRQDHVRRHVVLVDVEHRVREEPVVERRVLGARLAQVAPVDADLLPRLELADRGVLLGVVAELLDPVGVVVELLEELRVRDRQVVALEVVVDVDLPVALDQVLAPLDQAHVGPRHSRRQPPRPGSRPAPRRAAGRRRRGRRRRTGPIGRPAPASRPKSSLRSPRSPPSRGTRAGCRRGRRSSRGIGTGGDLRFPRVRATWPARWRHTL